MNGRITTKDGTQATTDLRVTQVITNSCKPTGTHYLGCKIVGDASLSEKTVIDENAFTFDSALGTTLTGCEYTEFEYEFEPLKVIVGIGPINVGIIEGKGEAVDSMGNFPATASGEMTLGQYTEAGVNKGSAKGVFKIQ